MEKSRSRVHHGSRRKSTARFAATFAILTVTLSRSDRALISRQADARPGFMRNLYAVLGISSNKRRPRFAHGGRQLISDDRERTRSCSQLTPCLKTWGGSERQVCQLQIVSTMGFTPSMCAKCVPAPQESAFYGNGSIPAGGSIALRSFFAGSINFGEDGRTRGRATRHHRTPAPTISTRTW